MQPQLDERCEESGGMRLHLQGESELLLAIT